jgi:hypothetical protein
MTGFLGRERLRQSEGRGSLRISVHLSNAPQMKVHTYSTGIRLAGRLR